MQPKNNIKTSVERHFTRRYESEGALNKVLPYYLEPNKVYFTLSNGDVDQFAYLNAIVKQARFKKVHISMMIIAMTDAKMLAQLCNRGCIESISFTLHPIMFQNYPIVTQFIQENITKDIKKVWNHAKIILGYGDSFDFALIGSANLNTNKRSEQSAIYTNRAVVDMYYNYYKNLKIKKGFSSFEKMTKKMDFSDMEVL